MSGKNCIEWEQTYAERRFKDNSAQIIKEQSALIKTLEGALKDREAQVKRWSELAKTQEKLIDTLIKKR